MTKITVYDTESARISDLADDFQCTEAVIIEALFNLLDSEARMRGISDTSALADYI